MSPVVDRTSASSVEGSIRPPAAMLPLLQPLLNSDFFRTQLSSHPDAEFVSFVLDSITNGVDITVTNRIDCTASIFSVQSLLHSSGSQDFNQTNTTYSHSVNVQLLKIPWL
jgi:hypothetical protein